MKLTTLVLTLSLVTSALCNECKPSIDDIVVVLENEVDSYDQFIYNRYLKSDELTCEAVNKGINKLKTSFVVELAVVLAEPRRLLETVKKVAQYTDAGPCVDHMTTILERIIREENIRFQQCLGVRAAHTDGLQQDLSREKNEYEAHKNRVKENIRDCLVNSPDTCPSKTNKCMDTQIEYFNNVANDLTKSRVVRSPCMNNFVEVMKCYSDSVDSVVRRARQVQLKTIACVSFEDNPSVRNSLLAFGHSLNVSTTMLEQVKGAQRQFEELNNEVVKTLGKYYSLEKSANMAYEFRVHNKEYFKKWLYQKFAAKLSTVEDVRRRKRHVWPDNKADKCCDQAITDINKAIDTAAGTFETCEKDLIDETKVHIQKVRHELGIVADELSRMGDAAIMDCLNNGVIYSGNAVEGCYDLRLRTFRLDQQDALERVGESMVVLERYNRTYFSVEKSSKTPCGHTGFDRTVISVDRVMFQLNRCPYIFDDRSTTTTTGPTITSTTSPATTTPILHYHRYSIDPE